MCGNYLHWRCPTKFIPLAERVLEYHRLRDSPKAVYCLVSRQPGYMVIWLRLPMCKPMQACLQDVDLEELSWSRGICKHLKICLSRRFLSKDVVLANNLNMMRYDQFNGQAADANVRILWLNTHPIYRKDGVPETSRSRWCYAEPRAKSRSPAATKMEFLPARMNYLRMRSHFYWLNILTVKRGAVLYLTLMQ